MNGTEPTADSRLLRLDTCAVSDALDKLKITSTVTGLCVVFVPADHLDKVLDTGERITAVMGTD